MKPLLHGIFLSFGLILPLGVQNVFVLSQGMNQPRFIYALPAVITAACCDTLLIAAAVGGVSLLLLQYEFLKLVLTVLGILFMLYMGWVTWKSVPNTSEEVARSYSPGRQILFAAGVSLLNPHAILDTVGVIGTSAAGYMGSERLIFTLACVLVSWVWFFALALAGRLMGGNKAMRYVVLLNKTAAALMWGAAVYLVMRL